MNLRDRKKRQARRQWLQAARTCFVAQGYEATTVERLAEVAGLSRPGFFLYYPNKAAVRTALRLELLQALFTLAAQETERGGNAADIRARSLQRLHRYLLDNQALVRACALFAAGLGEGEHTEREAWLQLTRKLFAEREAMELPLLAGLLRGAWQSLLLDEQDELRLRAVLREVFDAWESGPNSP